MALIACNPTGGPKSGFPKFKRKGERDSARFYEVTLEERHLRLPNVGRVRLKESCSERGFQGRVLSATVRRRADRWFASLCVEQESEITELKPVRRPSDVGGVDLGLESAAVIHDGVTTRVVEPQQALQKNLKKLRRLNRQLARKQKGSANRAKAKLELARLHHRIACQRQDQLHQLSSSLARTKSVIVVEDLHVRGMIKNKHLALSISDAGLGEFRRQLVYKINLRRVGLRALELPVDRREVTPAERKALASTITVEAKPASLNQEASGSPRPRRVTQRRDERLASAVTSWA